MFLKPATNELPQILTVFPPTVLGEKTPSDPDRFKKLVGSLPAEEAIAIIAKINTVVENGLRMGIHNFQDYILRNLCASQWIDISDYQRILNSLKQNGLTFEHCSFFSRPGCLELYKWLALYGSNEGFGSLNDLKRSRSFARAALLAFDFATRIQRKVLKDPDFDSQDNRDRLFSALRVFREASLQNEHSIDPLWQFGRSAELFHSIYFSDNPEYRLALENNLHMSLEDHLHLTVGLTSIISDWFNSAALLQNGFCFSPQKLLPSDHALKPALEIFLRKYGCTRNSLKQEFSKQSDSLLDVTDYLPVRKKPLFLYDGAELGTILDQRYLTELCSNGLLFEVAAIKGDAALQAFGDSFEKYCIKALNQYVASLRHKGIEVRFESTAFALNSSSGDRVEVADCLMLVDRTLFLFEIKGVWLRSDIIATKTPEEYWKMIYDKYVLSATKKGHRRKGVSQLAHSINSLLNGRLQFAFELPLTAFDNIVPILFVYDAHMGAPFHGRFLAEEFQKILLGFSGQLMSNMVIHDKSVANVCLITADDFDNFDNRITTKSLAILIKDYLCKFPSRDVSLGKYLLHVTPDSWHPQPSIVNASQKVANEASVKLFGKSLD